MSGSNKNIPKPSWMSNLSMKFVNRDKYIVIYEKRISEIHNSTAPNILVFYGVGGQGKSALAEHIYTSQHKVTSSEKINYCISIKLTTNIANDPITLLTGIRNKFVDFGVTFEVFDYALSKYWNEARPEQPLINIIKPTKKDMLNWGKSVLLAGSETQTAGLPVAQTVVLLANKIFGDKVKKHTLNNRSYYKHLLYDNTLLPASKIFERLPTILAEDINFWRKDQKVKYQYSQINISILLDEYDRIIKTNAHVIRESAIVAEAFIKDIAVTLNSSIISIFTRDKLDWGEDWEDILADAHYSLNGLNKKHATELIHNAGIHNTAIIHAILQNARKDDENSDECIPLLISVQLTHIINQINVGAKINPEELILESISYEERKNKLVERLLRDYDCNKREIIQRLSFCEEFDQDIFIAICKRFNITLHADDFNELLNISIINKTDDGGSEILHVIADIIQANMGTIYKKETLMFLLEYHEKLAKVTEGLRFSHLNMHHVLEASTYMLQLEPLQYYKWLVKWTPDLRYNAFLTRGLGLWLNGYEAIKCEEPDKKLVRDFKLIIACFYCMLGEQNKCENLVCQVTDSGGYLTTLERSNLVTFSPTQKIADYWFNSNPLLKKRTLTSRNKHFLKTVINTAIENAHSEVAANQYMALMKELDIEEDEYTINAIIKKTESFEGAFEALKNIPTPTPHSYTLLITKSSNTDQALSVLRIIKSHNHELDKWHYNNLVHKYGEDAAEKVIKKAGLPLNIDKDVITYTSYISNANSYNDALTLYEAMLSNKLIPDGRCIAELLSKSESIDDVTHFLSESNKYGLPMNNYYWKYIINHIHTTDNLITLHLFFSNLNYTVPEGQLAIILPNIIYSTDHNLRTKYFNEVLPIANNDGLLVTLVEYMIHTERDHNLIEYWLKYITKEDITLPIPIIRKLIEASDSFDTAYKWLNYCIKNDLSIDEATLIRSNKLIKNIFDTKHLLSFVIDQRLAISHNMLISISKTIPDDIDKYINELYSFMEDYWTDNIEVLAALYYIDPDSVQRNVIYKRILQSESNVSIPALCSLISSESSFDDAIFWLRKYVPHTTNEQVLSSLSPLVGSFDDLDIIINTTRDNGHTVSTNSLQRSIKTFCNIYPATDLQTWLYSNTEAKTRISDLCPTAINSYVKLNKLEDATIISLINPTLPASKKLFRDHSKEVELALNSIPNHKYQYLELAKISLLLQSNRINEAHNLFLTLSSSNSNDIYLTTKYELENLVKEATHNPTTTKT